MKYLEIISQVTNIDIKYLKENLDKDGLWDSFAKVEIILELENEFGVKFLESELDQFKNARLIIELMERKVG